MKSENNLIPLAFMNEGERGILEGFRGMRHHIKVEEEPLRQHKQYRRGHLFHTDRGHRIEHHLKGMGLTCGRELRMIKNNIPGPVIVAVGDSRLCLGRGIASRIMVRPVISPSPEDS